MIDENYDYGNNILNSITTNESDPAQESDYTTSSIRGMSYSKQEKFYRKAKEEGYRARSVYKLKEIHYNFNILKDSSKFLDLCAAPGSWSQMLRILTKQNPNAKIVSVDIQDIVPIEGVNIIKGDITREDTLKQILSCFKGEKSDVVIFDGAPDVSGLIEIDVYMQVELIIFALVICLKVLKKGGKFVAKVFRMKEGSKISCKNYNVKGDFYYDKVKALFDGVCYYKPNSSRATSHEFFMICEGFGVEEEEVEKDLEHMSMEDIFNFEKLDKKSKTYRFLQFLINSANSL